MNRDDALRAVVTVGDGRGFVIQGGDYPDDRLIITAAHCLPFFPPCTSNSGADERTYRALLGPLGAKPSVWAECQFVDPIADLAVLSAPDNQLAYNEWEAYEDFVRTTTALPIAPAPSNGGARLLSLDRRWWPCTVQHQDGPLWIRDAAGGIVGGMSGSPILAEDGSAIGVVVTDTVTNDGPATTKVPTPC